MNEMKRPAIDVFEDLYSALGLATQNQNWSAKEALQMTFGHYIEGRDRREIEITDAIRNFVNKLDECKPHIDGAFQMAFQVRGREYKGPNYGEELKALRQFVPDTDT